MSYMNEKMYCEVPRFKIFDFHRHASEMNDFEKNLKEFNVGKFCLMPTTLENDFQDILSYIEKIKLYHDKFKDDAIIFGAIDFSQNKESNLELLDKQREKVNIKGIKIHPDQRFEIKKIKLKPYFDAISDILGQDVTEYLW